MSGLTPHFLISVICGFMLAFPCKTTISHGSNERVAKPCDWARAERAVGRLSGCHWGQARERSWRAHPTPDSTIRGEVPASSHDLACGGASGEHTDPGVVLLGSKPLTNCRARKIDAPIDACAWREAAGATPAPETYRRNAELPAQARRYDQIELSGVLRLGCTRRQTDSCADRSTLPHRAASFHEHSQGGYIIEIREAVTDESFRNRPNSSAQFWGTQKPPALAVHVGILQASHCLVVNRSKRIKRPVSRRSRSDRRKL